MNAYRALFAVVLSFAAAPALAQAVSAVAGEASLFAAPAATPDRMVPIRGVVSGSPESVNFSGQAKVSSRLAPDPDFNRPRLLLSIDLSGVSGVGSMTGAKYLISGPELVQRRVAASHTVEITFPFRGGKSPALRTGVATFALDFDMDTGAVTGASGNVVTPNFPR